MPCLVQRVKSTTVYGAQFAQLGGMLAAFILLCVAVMVLSAPAPYASWVSLVLAVLALLLAVFRHTGPVW